MAFALDVIKVEQEIVGDNVVSRATLVGATEDSVALTIQAEMTGEQQFVVNGIWHMTLAPGRP